MNLNNNELGYFIQQVGLSALSFGAAESDVEAVGDALTKLFGYRCSPETTVIPAQGAQYQAICEAESCPLAANATCAAYSSVATASSTSADKPSSTGGGSPDTTETGSPSTPINTGAAGKLGMGASAAVVLMALPWLI